MHEARLLRFTWTGSEMENSWASLQDCAEVHSVLQCCVWFWTGQKGKEATWLVSTMYTNHFLRWPCKAFLSDWGHVSPLTSCCSGDFHPQQQFLPSEKLENLWEPVEIFSYTPQVSMDATISRDYQTFWNPFPSLVLRIIASIQCHGWNANLDPWALYITCPAQEVLSASLGQSRFSRRELNKKQR